MFFSMSPDTLFEVDTASHFFKTYVQKQLLEFNWTKNEIKNMIMIEIKSRNRYQLSTNFEFSLSNKLNNVIKMVNHVMKILVYILLIEYIPSMQIRFHSYLFKVTPLLSINKFLNKYGSRKNTGDHISTHNFSQ